MSPRSSSLLTIAALCAAVVTSAASAQHAKASRSPQRHRPAVTPLAPIVMQTTSMSDETFAFEDTESDEDIIAPAPALLYDLQIVSIQGPIPKFSGDSAPQLGVEVTVKNLGRNSSPVAKLALDQKDGDAKKSTKETLVPPVPAGGTVTIRIPVAFPTNSEGTMCFTGKIEPLTRPDPVVPSSASIAKNILL